MDVRPSTFASPVFLRCLFLFVVDETSKMPSLEFTCVHLKYLPDSASQAKITSWGFQALPLLIRLRTRSSAALEALVLLSLAEQQKWNQFCVIFQSQNQQGCVPGNGLSRAQGCSPWAGLKAKGRISPWTFSCAHLPAPDALPAPSLAQGWLLSAFHTDQTQSLGSALIPVMQEMQGMHWCCGEGSRHRCDRTLNFSIALISAISRKHSAFCHECYLVYWGEVWILPGQCRLQPEFHPFPASSTAPECKGLSCAVALLEHAYSLSQVQLDLFTPQQTQQTLFIFSNALLGWWIKSHRL